MACWKIAKLLCAIVGVVVVGAILIRKPQLPPLRPIPGEDIQRARDREALRSARASVRSDLVLADKIAKDWTVSDALKKDVAQQADAMRDSVASNVASEIIDKQKSFRNAYDVVSNASSVIEMANEFLSSFGEDMSLALKDQVLSASVQVRKLKQGDDRAGLVSQTNTLRGFLVFARPVVAQVHKDIQRGRQIGLNVDDPSSPFSLQFSGVRRALQGASWPDVFSEFDKLPDLFKLYQNVFNHIDYAIDADNAIEVPTLEPFIAAVRDSLIRGDWASASKDLDTLKERLSEVNVKYGVATKAFRSYDPACVRILSIDGGGIRGVIPAVFLTRLEEKANKHASELFDYIVGTSTGGILALGLTVPNADGTSKYAAKDLLALYENEGQKIFPKSQLTFLRGLFGPKYGPDGIEPLLRKYFGERVLLGEAATRAIIPTYLFEGPPSQAKRTQRHLFLKSYRDTGAFLYMWEVARSASAAPTYFPPFRIPIPAALDHSQGKDESAALVDAGVFANNPTTYAISIVREDEPWIRDLDRNKSRLMIVSLGTGRAPRSLSYESAYGWGLFNWAEPLADIAFSDPGAEDATRDAVGRDDYYFRLQPEIDASIAAMDDASKKNISALKKAAEEYIDGQLDEIVFQLLRPKPRMCTERKPPF